MHLETIYQNYPRDDVEVAFVVSGADDRVRKDGFPGFLGRIRHDGYPGVRVSYTALDDRDNAVAKLYGLRPDSSVPQILIVDRGGVLRLVGRSPSCMEMRQKLDFILGQGKELDFSAVEKAVRALKAPESYVRWKAAQALGAMGDKAAVQPLIEASSDESPSVREFAARALGKIADEGAAEPLLNTLSDGSEGVREAAARALGHIGDPKAIAPLLGCLEDESSFVCLAAIEALGRMKDERAVSPLVKLLADSGLRASAADALVKVGHPELVEETLQKNLSTFEEKGPREFGEVHAQLGRAYKARKLYEHAISAYEKASEITNDNRLKRRYAGGVAELRRMVSAKGQ